MTTGDPLVPPAPEPDDKDWTWVLERPCPECGFDASSVSRSGIGMATTEYAAALVDRALDVDASERPAPLVWSPVEYACHARDVCLLFDERLRSMLAQDDPLFANWDQDETALAERYWEQEPGVVTAELTTAAEVIAQRWSLVSHDQWQRPGRRSNGSVFTVDTLARYFLHDLAHHVWDVRS